MKISGIKIISFSLAVASCFALSGCGETEDKSDLDLIIADLSTSYLDDDTPEETTSLSEEVTDASEEATTEQLVFSAVTGNITDLSETDIYITADIEEKVMKYSYDGETSVYGAETLQIGQRVTVTYNDGYAVAVVVI